MIDAISSMIAGKPRQGKPDGEYESAFIMIGT
jgi:hypothetical protein